MFEDLLILLLIVWLALPLGLIPAVIILGVKNSKLKKHIESSRIIEDIVDIPKKERRPLSFSIILIVGVIFVIMAGVVFATSGWRYMDGIAKTVMLMSMSAVFFTACAISEKKLKLEKTGFAFFMLGGIFLPVSILGIAFFKLLGPGFSFDENARYRVFLVMIAVTLAIMYFAGRRYRNSILVRYIFATITAAEYIALTFSVTALIYGERGDNFLLAVIMLTCGYLVFTILPSFRTVPAQIGFIVTIAAISFDNPTGALAAAACALFCTVVSIVINRKIYSGTAIVLFPFAVGNLVRLLTDGIVDEHGYHILTAEAGITMAVLAAVSFIVTIPALKRDLPESENGETMLSRLDLVKFKWIERVTLPYIFLVFMNVFIDNVGSYEEEKAGAFLAGAGAVVFFVLKAYQFHVNGREAERSFALTIGCITTAFALALAEPPELIESLYYCALAELAVLPIVFIWKKHKAAAGTIVFIQTILVLAAYMLCTLDMNREDAVINAVILIGTCTLMAVMSFIFRSRKWFILSAAASLVTVAFLTEKIWRFSLWWIFLLAVGLIFIVYAGVNEYCRQKGQENPLKSGIKAINDKVWK
ncbi:MAG: hypothetical protein ILP22_07405 [Oscillospiraceae bacterium]|nr:hypothetical protein [Oscillospiraceae bacterium]